MTIDLVITLFVIGFAGSFISGLVGIGGSIIKYPMLLYIPPALGFVAYTAHEVSGISAVQVFFATLAAVWTLRKDKLIHYQLVVYMGSAIIVGSLLGGYGGKFLSADAINIVYAILATIAVILMFLPKKRMDGREQTEVIFHKPTAVLSALIVGGASGIVGAAGAFILVPIMLTILKIPTRVTIASSLAITFLSSIGSTIGKWMAGDILLWPSVIMVIASIMAAPLGTKVSKRLGTRILQTILALLILATTIKIWADILISTRV
ncbi:sulfite exporter TauE/SafE family protein [Brevibacillus porteri]|uniref:Probable membrane transporter protein n=1 Tax=Brevibacillus porteri TaxID=2126350 RepID=A0ABX5FR45_9BACL|nr:sulfite exporter TauE/SafE family protein [Brevibacillus porteri]MED1801226.1 sulfite exporter TauE/SafE family protein [Brevibacillus porteri]MED2134574.1 sulfite exporter TauE/SafE family protein [Brevibacillus porteri]MED2744895.1 sulfite exporter TauE/SafE family protein [Brevibacillus porteri]MED2813103.1 sulfite exporter TauE/SafE family protein [Brevibacillus porteri]MED2896092.1 sulfite exporter TauE/SafE family protein [Brevibacillus porteri]